MTLTSKTFLISDTHFSHKNIIKHGSRPFVTTQEMNDTFVANWNRAVGAEDKVIHLGDVAMWKPRELEIVHSLNGSKYLIRGNHDTFPTDVYKRAGFLDVLGLFEFHLDPLSQVVCTHIPLHPMELSPPFGRWAANVHGHIHQNRVLLPMTDKIDSRYLCISVEHTNYAPLELSEIKTRLLNQ